MPILINALVTSSNVTGAYVCLKYIARLSKQQVAFSVKWCARTLICCMPYSSFCSNHKRYLNASWKWKQEEEERLQARLRMMTDYQSYDFSFKVLLNLTYSGNNGVLILHRIKASSIWEHCLACQLATFGRQLAAWLLRPRIYPFYSDLDSELCLARCRTQI